MLAFFPEFGVHECKLASMALGGILTQATLLLIYQSAGLLMSEKRAFWTGVLAVFFCHFITMRRLLIQMFQVCSHWR